MECGTPDAKYQRSSYPYVVDEVPPLRVDGRDSRAAVEHIGPFRGFVPVQFAHAAGIEAHVHPGDIFGDAELACRHLPRPATALLPHMSIGERETQVGQTPPRQGAHHVCLLQQSGHCPW